MPIINLFNLYSVIRSLKPKIIVESGTFKGQSSWFILKAAPKAKIYCFDIDLTQLIYKSNKIKYIEGDIKNSNLCMTDGCYTSHKFGIFKRVHCKLHKLPNEVNIVITNKKKCIEFNCSNNATYKKNNDTMFRTSI